MEAFTYVKQYKNTWWKKNYSFIQWHVKNKSIDTD